MHYPPGTPIRVRWRDAWFEYEGATDSEDYLVETLGFYVSDNTNFIDVAAERLPDGNWRAVTHIPQVLVQEHESLVAEL